MDAEELKRVLDLHGKWVHDEPGGVRADLSEANLSKANLSRANLSRANLSGANLSKADLSWANLSGANLSKANLSKANLYEANLYEANLSKANLSGADLYWADLSWADLSKANLSKANLSKANLSKANLSKANLHGAYLHGAYLHGANLSGADLYRADLSEADLSEALNLDPRVAARLEILPREGPVRGWKKCKNDVLVELLVPEGAKRSNGTERKCRAEFVDVLQVIGADVGISLHDGVTEYRVGQRVTCDRWSEDRWTTCGGGIHFYLTREEAEAHS